MKKPKFRQWASEFRTAVVRTASRDIQAPETLLSLDSGGRLSVESFRRLLECDPDRIAVRAKDKIIYIFGRQLRVLSYSKSDIYIDGKITKIEISEVK